MIFSKVVVSKILVFSPPAGEMIQFDYYFSDGLVQPPSRFERYDFPGELEAQRANFRSRLVFANFRGGLVRWIYPDRYTHLQLGLSRVLEELHMYIIHHIYDIIYGWRSKFPV